MRIPVHNQLHALQNRFKQCMESESKKDLVIALHDYVYLIDENPELDYLLSEKIQASPKKILKDIEKFEKKAQKDLDSIYKAIKSNLPKNLDAEEIFPEKTFLPSSYEDYRYKRVISSQGVLNSCARVLKEGILKIFEKDKSFRKTIGKYISLEEVKRDGFITNYHFGENYRKYLQLKRKFDNQLKIMPWGGFEGIYKCYLAVEAYAGNFEFVDSKILDKTTENSSFYYSAFENLFENYNHNVLSDDLLLAGYSEQSFTRFHYSLLEHFWWFENLNKSQRENFLEKATGIKKFTKLEKNIIKKIVFLKPKTKNGKYHLVLNDDGCIKSIRNDSRHVQKLISCVANNEKDFLFDEGSYIYLNQQENIFFGDGRYQKTQLIEKAGKNLLLSPDIEWKEMEDYTYKGTLKRIQKKKEL